MKISQKNSLSSVTLTQIFRMALFLAVILVASQTVHAAHLWVDRNSIGGSCDDSRHRDDVTEVTPWCTLGVSANNVQPGDTVHVREGEYTERQKNGNPVAWGSAVLQMVVSGTPEASIKFMAEPGETVVFSAAGGASWGILVVESQGLTPRFIEIDGFFVRDFSWKGAMVNLTSDVVLRNLEVTNCIEGAIAVLRSARVTVEGL